MTDTREQLPKVCEHLYAEHSSRYDLRCVHCGLAANATTESDDRMLEVWRQWAEQTGQAGAAVLFARIQWRLKKAADRAVPPPATASETPTVIWKTRLEKNEAVQRSVQIAGECFGISVEDAGPNACSSGKLATLYVEDDEFWHPVTSFDAGWLNDLFSVARSSLPVPTAPTEKPPESPR